MDIRFWFIDWTKKQIIHFALLIFIALLAIFVILNKGVGEEIKTNGEVLVVGIDSSTYYELPKKILTIKLKNGNVVVVGAERHTNVKVGDIVEVKERKRLITSGSVYKFSRVQK